MAKKKMKLGSPPIYSENVVCKSILLPSSWWKEIDKRAKLLGGSRNRSAILREMIEPHITKSNKA